MSYYKIGSKTKHTQICLKVVEKINKLKNKFAELDHQPDYVFDINLISSKKDKTKSNLCSFLIYCINDILKKIE